MGTKEYMEGPMIETEGLEEEEQEEEAEQDVDADS